MKRRDFLKITPAAAAPLLLNKFPVGVTEATPLLQMIANSTEANGRVLVLVQLNGGNDGLNTLIPLNQYAAMTNARSNVLIPQNAVLSLNGQTNTGFHPAMTEMRSIYNAQLMNILQCVSYPNPNFSHFRATDIWFTGSQSDVYLQTGWLGRYLNEDYPGFPQNYPNTNMPDPLAVQIGSQATIMTQGPSTNMCMTMTDPEYFYNLVNGITDPAPPTPYGHELTYIRLVKQQTNAYTARVRTAYNGSANAVTYPTNNELAEQLKIVARLIKGGLKTPIYVVNHPDSFDTHSNQVLASDKTKGAHADMLGILSKAINAFQNDLQALGVADRVVTTTFTEFGRRIKSNNSGGTDHGSATPVFFFGPAVNPVIVGTNPQLPLNAGVDDNIAMQHDFRAVYYTILREWFQLTIAQLNTVLFTSYPILPIFRTITSLPVKLISLSGKWVNDDDIEVKWVVEEETDINKYEIIRSSNNIDFVRVGAVSALNNSAQHIYSFADRNLPEPIYYYKLNIIEHGGANKFSEVITVRRNNLTQAIKMKVLPNPVRKTFTLAFESSVTGVLTLRMVSLEGKEVWKQVMNATGALNLTFDLGTKSIPSGVYMLQVFSKNKEGVVKVVVQQSN